MGLLSTSVVFNQAWVDGLKAVPAKFMNVTIDIHDGNAVATWNPATLSYDVTGGALLYSGPARVTPRRGALSQPLRENPTVTQHVQFQIPIDRYDFDLRNKCSVVVTDSPLNPTLLSYAYRVHEIVDSGNPIEYTFWCIVDQEVVNG